MGKAKTAEQAVGDAIRAVRLETGQSQEQLAFNSGLHRTYIGSVERGERNVSLKNLVAISKALGLEGAGQLLCLAKI
jgi:transcriptional regulator with XRE-family HTH domain